jgi:hypothetical protein
MNCPIQWRFSTTGLVPILVAASMLGLGSSCIPMGFEKHHAISAYATRWLRTGKSVLVITREDVARFEKELSIKADDYVKGHPNLPDQRKECLRKFNVCLGMSKEEVQLLLNEPFERVTTPEKLPGLAKEEWKDTEVAWLYRIQSSLFNNAVGVLYFREGSLTHIMEYGDYFVLW